MVYLPELSTPMANPDMGIFSNNNYIPDIGQFHQHPRPDIAGVSPCLAATPNITGVTGYPGSFTFTVPTQASLISAGLAQTSQQRVLYSSPSPYCVVPGIGASWQHAVPTHMPFGGSITSQASLSHIATFTGLTSLSSRPHISICSPKQSYSETARRHKKRHATEEIESSSPMPKVLLTEEKMAARLGNLSLSNTNKHCQSSSFLSSSMPDLLVSSKHQSLHDKKLSEGLKRLQEIEERLEDDISDEGDDREEDDSVGGTDRKLDFKFHIDHRVARKIFDPQPLLPKKILEDLSKPCLEVVLWKPPGGFQALPPKDSCSAPQSRSQSNFIQRADEHIDRPLCSNEMDSDMQTLDMEADLFDCTDDDMQL